MAKIRKIYSSVWEKWAKKSIFGKKRPNFDQKRPKNRKQEFSRGNFFHHFLKNQQIGSYGKDQENLQQRLGEMGQKEHFWTKTTKFWPKTAKKSKTRIFAKNPKRHKSKFYGCPTSCKKPEKLIARFWLQNRNQRTHTRTDAGTEVNLQVPSGNSGEKIWGTN